MSFRRLAAGTLVLTTLGALVTAQAASRPQAAAYAPTVAYKAAAANALIAPENRAIPYRGAPLRFAATKMQRESSEPTVGVTKSGTVFTVAAAFDSRLNTDAKKFPRTIMYMSRDGGRTFSPLKAALDGSEANETTLDPYVYVDPDYGRAFNVDLLGAGTAITYTDDKGETFGRGFANVAGFNDHQTLTAGVPPKGNPTLIPQDPSFPKIVYYCVNTVARIACAHSIDGGRTYLEAGTSPSKAVATTGGLVCGNLHGHIVTDLDGRLFIPRNECGRLILSVSEDGGLTWVDNTVATSLAGSDPDASVAVDRVGNLYYTWYDEKRKLPYLTVSRDHGVTWGAPRMIAPPGVAQTWFPVVDVGDPGKIAIWMMGSTENNNKDGAQAWNNYAVLSTDALSANPTFVSTMTNKPGDPAHRGECDGRCGRVYDFLDVVVAPADSGRVWTTAIDTCIGVCATSRAKGFEDDVVAPDHGKSDARIGYVLRQISGPALRGSTPITADTRR